MEHWRLGHRPSLTGLRAVAVTLVLATHVGAPYSGELGATGVTMFFTLSGFLITTLLLEERERHSRIDVLAFYRRRLLRLGPALVACVVLAVAAELLVVGHVADWSLVIGSLTWTSNFVMIDGRFPVTPLSHTWSLAIEEQFYLVWPLLLLVLVRLPRRWFLLALTYLIVAGIVTRISVVDPSVYLGHYYLGLDTRADQLLIGAFLAVVLVGMRPRSLKSRWALVLVAAVVALGLNHPGTPLFPTLVALLTAGALYVLAHTESRVLAASGTVWVGERAYGIYLYHRPIGYVVDDLIPSGTWWGNGALTIALTLITAAASFRWLEAPIRRYGISRRSAPEPSSTPA